MTLAFPHLPRVHSQSVELGPNELARVELCAVTEYDNPAFSPEVVGSVVDKAEQRVSAAYSAKALGEVEVAPWLDALAERAADSTGAARPSVSEVLRALEIGDTIADEMEELADTVKSWRELAAGKPEFEDDEVLLVRAALGWRAVTALDPATRLEARAARRQYDELPGGAAVAWTHVRYAARVAVRHAVRVARRPRIV